MNASQGDGLRRAHRGAMLYLGTVHDREGRQVGGPACLHVGPHSELTLEILPSVQRGLRWQLERTLRGVTSGFPGVLSLRTGGRVIALGGGQFERARTGHPGGFGSETYRVGVAVVGAAVGDLDSVRCFTSEISGLHQVMRYGVAWPLPDVTTESPISFDYREMEVAVFRQDSSVTTHDGQLATRHAYRFWTRSKEPRPWTHHGQLHADFRLLAATALGWAPHTLSQHVVTGSGAHCEVVGPTSESAHLRSGAPPLLYLSDLPSDAFGKWSDLVQSLEGVPPLWGEIVGPTLGLVENHVQALGGLVERLAKASVRSGHTRKTWTGDGDYVDYLLHVLNTSRWVPGSHLGHPANAVRAFRNFYSQAKHKERDAVGMELRELLNWTRLLVRLWFISDLDVSRVPFGAEVRSEIVPKLPPHSPTDEEADAKKSWLARRPRCSFLRDLTAGGESMSEEE